MLIVPRTKETNLSEIWSVIEYFAEHFGWCGRPRLYWATRGSEQTPNCATLTSWEMRMRARLHQHARARRVSHQGAVEERAAAEGAKELAEAEAKPASSEASHPVLPPLPRKERKSRASRGTKPLSWSPRSPASKPSPSILPKYLAAAGPGDDDGDALGLGPQGPGPGAQRPAGRPPRRHQVEAAARGQSLRVGGGPVRPPWYTLPGWIL